MKDWSKREQSETGFNSAERKNLRAGFKDFAAIDFETAPVFPEVWKQIEPLIEGLPLVAHNKPFDEGCLKAVFRVYQMDYPDYEFYDTLCVSRRVLPDLENHQLHTVAAACGYQLENHHHALADAEACAWIAREIL